MARTRKWDVRTDTRMDNVNVNEKQNIGQEYEKYGNIKNNLSYCFIGLENTYSNSILDVAMGPACIS